MDELARQIGWTVMIIGVIYVIGKFIITHGEEKDRQRNSILHTEDLVRSLAYRKIYRSTTDSIIHDEIKRLYPFWALLELELDDSQYRQKMSSGAMSSEFYLAMKDREERGDFCKLIDGKFVYRPTQGWGAADA